MIDYSTYKIYKIESEKGDGIYIGATVRSLDSALIDHFKQYQLYKDKNIRWSPSFKLFDKYGSDNCKITLIEDYPCKKKKIAELRRDEIIASHQCVNY